MSIYDQKVSVGEKTKTKNSTLDFDFTSEPQPSLGDRDYSDYYDQALKGVFGGVQRDAPQPGYYRLKDGNTPVGIWRDDAGYLVIHIGKEADLFDEEAHEQTWLHACKKPVLKRHWLKAVYGDGKWADIPDAPVLSNEPDDPYENLLARVNGAMERADEFFGNHEKIEDETQASMARNLAEGLRLLVSEADPMFVAEKKPWLDGGRGVDERYSFRKDVEAKRKRIDAYVNQYLAHKEAARRAAERAEAERLEAERKKAEKKGKPAPDPVAIVETPKLYVGGAVGRSKSLQITYHVQVANYISAFTALVNLDPNLKAAVDKAASDHAKKWKDQASIDGCVITNNLGEVISDMTAKPQPAKRRARA